ncbi:MAG: NAD(P)H-hydrate epimerase [Paracoccaceae bacterium]|nr:NAD(P)H-hydrate epimerase [Paracoccaceae bacterium]
MTELLTAAQMRAIEEAAIASGEVTGLELMERAGQGVVEAIIEEWPEFGKTAQRAVVLCGPGNNGGDGFVVARLLRERGWEVEVFLYGEAEKLPTDARVNYERWGEIGNCRELDDFPAQFMNIAPAIVVDGLLGTGMSRPANQLLRRVFRDVQTCRFGSDIEARVVAIDVPSGICSNSGRTITAGDDNASPDYDQTVFDLEDALAADLTVTFHRRKVGQFLGDGPQYAGKLRIAPLGYPLDNGANAKAWLHAAAGLPARPLRMGLLTVRTDEPLGTPDLGKESAHKYTHGHALLLAGGPGRGGAARLAARGALRIGAGLVTLACPAQAQWENAARLDAIMLKPLDGVAGLRELLEDDRINAVGLGPGLGLGPDTQHLVLAALEASRPGRAGPRIRSGAGRETPTPASEPGPRADNAPRRAVVLDADALTRFERNPEVLFEALHENCALTPHAGEFARLFPEIAEKLAAPATAGPAYSKVDATREAAARAGCTVLFKGPDTVIADQTGRCSINSAHYDRAAPWLATAGAGDVLTGFITGLLARGLAPMPAAETAAWLHVECARSFGPGLIAEDLPEELPKVFRALGL